MKKRILVLLAALVMALTMVAVPAAGSMAAAPDTADQTKTHLSGPWCHWSNYYGRYVVKYGSKHYYHYYDYEATYYNGYWYC